MMWEKRAETDQRDVSPATKLRTSQRKFINQEVTVNF